MSVVVEVSARHFMVPRQCACCGAKPEAELAATHTRVTGVRVIREQTRGLMFPYCSRCVGHVKQWSSAGSVANVCRLVGAVAAVLVAVAGGGVGGFFITIGVAYLVGFVLARHVRSQARLVCDDNCACACLAVKHRGWSGSVTSFQFASDQYAIRFALDNSRNLINVSSELRRMLEDYAERRPPLIEPQPAPPRIRPSVPQAPGLAAQALAMPVMEDALLDWISRIESYKGAEARRNVLQRAMAQITEPRARRQLILAASRIEVAAVLEKVDSLATVEAKRRHLQGDHFAPCRQVCRRDTS